MSLREKIALVSGGTVSVIIVIALSPLILLLIIVLLIMNYVSDRKYLKWLKSVEGHRFIFYTARRKTCEFITQKLLPELSADVTPVSRKGDDITSVHDPGFVRRLMTPAEKKWPFIGVVENGKIRTYSINDHVRDVMYGKIPFKILLERIAAFWSR